MSWPDTAKRILDYNIMKNKIYGRKAYLKDSNMSDARLIFKSICKMMQTVKMNFKNDLKFMKDSWACSGCSLRDSQEHLLWCSAYAHLREGLSLDSDRDLESYYRNILRLRNEE